MNIWGAPGQRNSQRTTRSPRSGETLRRRSDGLFRAISWRFAFEFAKAVRKPQWLHFCSAREVSTPVRIARSTCIDYAKEGPRRHVKKGLHFVSGEVRPS
eukprot:scaffold1627_cov238-Pinguiococcus_pyrenoidosus.AAC.5